VSNNLALLKSIRIREHCNDSKRILCRDGKTWIIEILKEFCKGF